MQTNSAVEQSKIIRWSESPCNQSGRKKRSQSSPNVSNVFVA